MKQRNQNTIGSRPMGFGTPLADVAAETLADQIPEGKHVYWYVFRNGIGGHSPTRKHKTERSARLEAKRLAHNNNGSTFVVAQVVAEYIVPNEPLVVNNLI